MTMIGFSSTLLQAEGSQILLIARFTEFFSVVIRSSTRIHMKVNQNHTLPVNKTEYNKGEHIYKVYSPNLIGGEQKQHTCLYMKR